MMKTSVVLVLFGVCQVYCIPTYNQKDSFNFYPDVASNMKAKAKDTILNARNCQQIPVQKAHDCADIFHMGYNKSGVYQVWPLNRVTERKYLNVYCDMDTHGGGWTVIQRRGDFKTPKDYFYRDWENYKEGFGDIAQDFWLGNDNIYALTNQKLYSVRFDLMDVAQNKSYALYDKFWIDNEDQKYALHIFMYTGNAGDSMAYHNRLTFSTLNQGDSKKCVVDYYKGGWWYGNCDHHANLNGLYHKGKFSGNRDGVSWQKWKGDQESLEWTEIKIRPKYFRAPLL